MKESEKESRRWYLQAEDDRRFVQWVLSEGVFFDKGCFLAQQAGKKVLKACLYALGKRRVIGHSLFEMLSELSKPEKHFNQVLTQAKQLDRFYITTRYPNGLPGGSPYQFYAKKDLEEAFKDLTDVFNLSQRFLKERGIQI
jgi:HEPN domain-containing protein